MRAVISQWPSIVLGAGATPQQDRALHTYIVYEENFLPGIALTLQTADPQTQVRVHAQRGSRTKSATSHFRVCDNMQELVATATDMMSAVTEHQTLICGTDDMLKGLVMLCQNSSATSTRQRVLHTLVQLSANSKNRFVMVRQQDLLEQLVQCLADPSEELTRLAIQALFNLTLPDENSNVLRKMHSAITERLCPMLAQFEQSADTADADPTAFAAAQDHTGFETKDLIVGIVTLLDSRQRGHYALD